MIRIRSCWKCGKETQVKTEEYNNPYKLITYDKEWNNRKNLYKREYCAECKKKVDEEIRADRDMYLALKAKMMLERAITILEKQNIDVYEYREAIEVVAEKSSSDASKFNSAEEMVAAIVLIQNEIRIKVNHKIGTYIADIFIPSLTCIVEIDGFLHDREEVKFKDGNKDLYVRSLLGKEWEVVRIPTKYIHKKAENLLSAIIEVKAKMVELRLSNEGFLPYNFSKTMNAVYNKILKR